MPHLDAFPARGVPVVSGFMRSVSLIVALFISCLIASGCAHMGGVGDYIHNGLKVGPEYGKPAAPIADTWIDEYDERVRADLPNYADWWVAFNDPVMSRLMEDMYRQNLELRIAGLRVLEARYLRAIAVGSIFPQSQSVVGDFTHNQISKNTVLVPPNAPRAFDDNIIGFSAAWELDVWGKFRRNIEAADASLDASIEGYDGILVCLLAETASNYVDLRTAQSRLQYARSNLATQEGSLRIATSRWEEGLTSEVDVAQARTQAERTGELIPLFENEVRLANNRLCVLLGISPRDLTQEIGRAPIPVAPPNVAVGIPADLLRRRPDVRRFEREVAAQSARIGVAAADLYPHFSIRGTIEWQAENLSDVFRQGSTAGTIAPGFTWDILNYGRLLNNVRVQDTRFQQLAVDYQQTVLDANAEAENAINSFLKFQQRLLRIREAAKAAQRGVDLAVQRYQDGLDNFDRVFILQTELLTQQDRSAFLEGQIATSLIAIYKALGGGWEIRYGVRGTPPMAAVPVQQQPANGEAPPMNPPDDELPPLPQDAV